MNWEQIEGQWKLLKAKARQKWGKLTDDDLEQIKGRREELVARLETRYGHKKEALENEVDDWMSKIDSPRRSS